MTWLRWLRLRSRMREAPSITCIRSSHMEPVTSKTTARVASPVMGGSAGPGAPAPAAAAESASSSRRSGVRGMVRTAALELLLCLRGAQVGASAFAAGCTQRLPSARLQRAVPLRRVAACARGTGAGGGVPLLGARGGS